MQQEQFADACYAVNGGSAGAERRFALRQLQHCWNGDHGVGRGIAWKGTVSAIGSRSCGTNAVTFRLMAAGTATTSTTDANTKFEDTSRAALAVNDVVEVKGNAPGERRPGDGHRG